MFDPEVEIAAAADELYTDTFTGEEFEENSLAYCCAITFEAEEENCWPIEEMLDRISSENVIIDKEQLRCELGMIAAQFYLLGKASREAN